MLCLSDIRKTILGRNSHFFKIMEKQELQTRLQATNTAEDLLTLLNEIKKELAGEKVVPFTMRKMMVLCNPKKKNRYHHFYIPKKSGGDREINVPNGNLKWFQLCLNEIFKTVYTPSPYATGFTVGKSVITNAQVHVGNNYVFNIDLKDFFPSIKQPRVWKRLQLPPFNFKKEIANIIAGLCSIEETVLDLENKEHKDYCLPQGAPTSPLLTNAICDNLDRRLNGLAKRFGVKYTRYADDITFSSMQNVYQEGSEFRLELERIIIGQNFKINTKKTRLQHRSQRQEVTGITVDVKPNVSKKYVKDIRALLHIWEKYGYNAAYAKFYPVYKSDKGLFHKGEPNLENVLHGKLCYLKMVKGEKDPVYSRLQSQFKELVSFTAPNPIKKEWDYLFTLPLKEFEKVNGIGIKYRYKSMKGYSLEMDGLYKTPEGNKITQEEYNAIAKENKAGAYGFFRVNENSYLIVISKGIDISNIPGNAEVSLCRVKDKYYPEGFKIMYMLHKKHISRNNPSNEHAPGNTQTEIPPSILEIARLYPELELADELDRPIGETDEQLLSRLVENFDLSILP